ncbi:MAG TPA: thiamine-phosphate kinase [Bryobacteraceae bacterium]|nr:thiamine-phosphate kinase [Bryobacteraceae bacterium]
MTEDNILDRIRGHISIPRRSRLILGMGDDCAIFRPPGSPDDLLFTTDLLLENVHFRRDSHTAADAGHKALARGLSDIAAMGGNPMFCLLSLALPERAGQKWIDEFFAGLLKLASKTGTILAGGDLAHSERFACDIVVAGSVPKGCALRRDGARPGEAIYVSGRLGGSALGLRTHRGPAWKRHLRPAPRLALGRFLRERIHASAAMDLSDGLSLDLRRLCLASNVSAEIEAPPVFSGATLEDALNGGEDYELLFTAPPGARVPAHFESLPLTRIGTIRRGNAGRVTLNGQPLVALGYDHFRRS